MKRLMTHFTSLTLLIITFNGCTSANSVDRLTQISSDPDYSRLNNNVDYNERRINPFVNLEPQWRELHSGLWVSDTGEVGFKVSVFEKDTMDFHIDYITTIYNANVQLPLKQIIDTDSFHRLTSDSVYFKDNNNLYRYFAMAGGGTLSTYEDADYDSFEVLSSCFAKDKYHIFHWRDAHVNTNFDYSSFRTCQDCGCVAKDKKHYYVVGQEIELEDINSIINDPTTYEATVKALKFLSQ